MSMKKYVGILLCLLLLAFFFKGISSQEDLSQDTDFKPDISELTVAISCGNHYGCGTILDCNDSLTVVTALHVIEDYLDDTSTDIVVSFFDKNTSPAKVLKTDAPQDLAFLTVEMSALKDSYCSVLGLANSLKSPLQSSQSSGSGALQNAEVTTTTNIQPSAKIFFADANTKKVHSGTVASASVYSEDLALDVIYCYCNVTPGMSGTGMFGEEGNYLGILLGGSTDSEAVCLSASKILAAYRK